MKANPDFPVTGADWDKIAARIDTTNGDPGFDECWLWTGPLVRSTPASPANGGYGQTGRIAGKRRLAHRVAWLFFRGELGPELTIDHLCHTPECGHGICDHRRCINPWHMTPVDRMTNAHRSSYFSQVKTHCVKGHVMDGRRKTTGEQYCRECIRLSTQRWRERRRDGVGSG